MSPPDPPSLTREKIRYLLNKGREIRKAIQARLRPLLNPGYERADRRARTSGPVQTDGGMWKRPKGSSRAHWFDLRGGICKSACSRYTFQLRDPLALTDTRRCWECAMNRCPTRDHPLGKCPGDHGK